MAVDPEIQQMIADAASAETPAKPAEPQETLEQKVGRLVNENADRARREDALRLELEGLKQQLTQRPQPQTQIDPNKNGWAQFAQDALKEVTDDELLTSPRQAIAKGLAAGAERLTGHILGLAEQKAWEAAGATRADMEYATFYPADLDTDMGKLAVRQAIAEVRGDQRFQQLMMYSSTRPKAFEVIHKIADKKLGRAEPMNDQQAVWDNTPTPRKSVYAAPSGVRTGGMGGVPASSSDKEPEGQKGISSLMSYVKATGDRGV